MSLQLVAEAVSAAGLIEPGAGADAGVEGLFDEPRQEAVEGFVAGLDAQRPQALLPRRLRLRQRRGAFPQRRDGLQGFFAAARPANGETVFHFLARRQRQARFQRPAALAAALFEEAVGPHDAAVPEEGLAFRARFRRRVESGEIGDARHDAARQTDAVFVPGVQPGGVAGVHAQKPVHEGGDGAGAGLAGGVLHRDFHAEGVRVRADIERRFKAQAVRSTQKAGSEPIHGWRGRA